MGEVQLDSKTNGLSQPKCTSQGVAMAMDALSTSTKWQLKRQSKLTTVINLKEAGSKLSMQDRADSITRLSSHFPGPNVQRIKEEWVGIITSAPGGKKRYC